MNIVHSCSDEYITKPDAISVEQGSGSSPGATKGKLSDEGQEATTGRPVRPNGCLRSLLLKAIS